MSFSLLQSYYWLLLPHYTDVGGGDKACVSGRSHVWTCYTAGNVVIILYTQLNFAWNKLWSAIRCFV